jgi:hypothetical protein
MQVGVQGTGADNDGTGTGTGDDSDTGERNTTMMVVLLRRLQRKTSTVIGIDDCFERITLHIPSYLATYMYTLI